MSKTYAHLVDVSKWQEPYLDDGQFEILKLYGVIQKAADGLHDYTDPDSWHYKNWWKEQYDSIAHFDVKPFYHWLQVEVDATKQADLALSILDKGLYVAVAVDYEAHDNVIDEKSAFMVKIYIDRIRSKTDKPVLLYCNEWLYHFLERHLGKKWLESVDLWIAGGIYYNKPFSEPVDDEILAPITRALLWQYSADKNAAADEMDFGTSEKGSIDINRFNGRPWKLYRWAGVKGAWYKIPRLFSERILRLKLGIE